MAELHRRVVPEELIAGSSTIPGELARRIRVVLFDVDGVLTDSGVYLGMGVVDEAIEFKRFDIQDGLGLKLLQEAGLVVAVVSGRVSRATTVRMRELGIHECHQEAGADKLPFVQDLLDRHGADWPEVAMLADDLPDLAVLSRVGLPAAVSNAQPEIAERAQWISVRSGGHGAAREFCRALLTARGEWDGLVESYLSARGGEGVGPAGAPESPS